MEGEGGGSKSKDGKDGSNCQLQRPLSIEWKVKDFVNQNGERDRDTECSKMVFVCLHVRFYSDLCHL